MQELFKKLFHLNQNIGNLYTERDIITSKINEQEIERKQVSLQLSLKMNKSEMLFIGDEGVYYLVTKGNETGRLHVNTIEGVHLK